MYGTLYTSSEYYDYYEHIVPLDDELDKLCFVCWLPSNKEPVVHMNEIVFFLSSCNCNALIHSSCLKKWIHFNSSCPICRKNVSKMLINCDDKYIKLTKYSLICFHHIYYFLKFASLFTTIYVSFYVFYVCFFLDVSFLYDNSSQTDYYIYNNIHKDKHISDSL